MSADPHLSLGSVVGGRYRLGPIMGRGGMAVVYRAEDLVLDRAVALKVARPDDELMAARLRREIQLVGRAGAPAMPHLFDAGRTEGTTWLAMELIEGPSLRRLLDQHGPLPPQWVSTLARDLAEALIRLHEEGIVHRDLKPTNVLLECDGGHLRRARLIDLSASRSDDVVDDLTHERSVVGTLTYLAPEQATGAPVGTPADVWALGALLYECLTGRRPFGGTPAEQVAARHAGPLRLPDGGPPGVADAVTAMTAVEPAWRPTARQALALLCPDRNGSDRRPMGSAHTARGSTVVPLGAPATGEAAATRTASLTELRSRTLRARRRFLAASCALAVGAVAALAPFGVSAEPAAEPEGVAPPLVAAQGS